MSGGGTGWSLRCPPTQTIQGFKNISVGCSFQKIIRQKRKLLCQSLSQWEICPTCSDVEGKVLHWSSQAHQWQFQNHQGWFAYVHIYSLAENYKYSKSQSISTKITVTVSQQASWKQALLLDEAKQLLKFPGIHPDGQPEVLCCRNCCCWSIWSNTHLRSHLGYISESSHNTLKVGQFITKIEFGSFTAFPPLFLLPGRWTQTLGCKGWLLTDCIRNLQEKHTVFNYLTIKTYGNNLRDSYYFHFLSWTTLFW